LSVGEVLKGALKARCGAEPKADSTDTLYSRSERAAARYPRGRARRPAAARAGSPAFCAGGERHFVVTLTVTLLLALFESVCGSTVWTEAVFTICSGTLGATTLSVIVT
jgi:hypothetical protein